MCAARRAVVLGIEARFAGELAYGHQKRIGVGIGLATRPKLLLLDEPSLGLAPSIVGEMFRAIEAIRAAETAQNLPSLSGNQERRRNRLEGSIYLRLI